MMAGCSRMFLIGALLGGVETGLMAAEKAAPSEKNGQAGVNMAAGKPCVFDPVPNYNLCTDPEDVRQLTDGVCYSGPKQLWAQKTTVGWRGAPYALTTIDLGKIAPIGKVSFSTAFDGPGNVRWPQSIKVFVSEDGRDFVMAGDLVDRSWPDGLPPALAPFGGKQHQVFHKYTGEINARGRFVCFAALGRYVFCDEIEICRGEDALLEKKAEGKNAGNVRAFLSQIFFREKATVVLSRDIATVQARIANLPTQENVRLMEKLSLIRQKIEEGTFRGLNDESRCVAPLNDAQRDIFRINAEALRSSKYPPLTMWSKNRWDPLDALEIPKTPPAGSPSLSVEMMDHEFRADAVNLTNATADDVEAEISFDGLPGGKMPEYLSVYQVEFVGTQEDKMIADPLVAAKKGEGGWRVTVPSGMTRQVWLSFNPRGIKAGTYRGSLLIQARGIPPMSAPLSLVLHSLRFPDHPRLSLTVWDYTIRPYAFRSATEQNVPLAIKDMRAHFVDTPYAGRKGACWPEKGDFDAEGNLIKPLRAAEFDEWTDRWKGSRRYHVYTGNTLSDFCGEPMGTPRFERMVAQWMAAFVKHAQSRGIRPEQIALHLFDEPSKDEQFKMNTVWGKAIKAGAPDLMLFTDPSFKGKSDAFKEMLAVHDMVCPHLPTTGGISKAVRDVCQAADGRSKRFWLYSCAGPARLLDPYYYHRLQAWHCWLDGAEGMGFWVYWNYYKTGNCTAWNEMMTREETWGLVYTTPDSVTTGKHWEAVREGVEDYEYLSMLSSRVEELKKKGVSSESLSKAEELLRDLPSQVAGKYDQKAKAWSVEKDRSLADTARIKVLKILTTLKD